MNKSSFYIRRQQLKKSSFVPLFLSFLLGAMAGVGGYWGWSHLTSNGPADAAAVDASATELVGGGARPVEDNSEAAEPALEKVFYTVQPGDTLSKIANTYATTMDALLLLNNLADANTIIVGQKLLVQDVVPSILFGRLLDNSLQIIQTSAMERTESILMAAKVFDSAPTVALSPHGTHILYTEKPIASSDGTITWVSRLDGSERMTLVSSDLRLPQNLGQLWSPRGDAVLYHFEENLWLARLDGSAPTLVTSRLPTDDQVTRPFAFSPDGADIIMINIESDRRLIERYSIERRDTELVYADKALYFTEIYWPVETRLYLVGAPSLTPNDNEVEVYRLGTAVGANLLPVTDNALPERRLVFAPESERFAFAVANLSDPSRAAERGIWLVQAGEKGQTQLYTASGSEASPLRFVSAGETHSLYLTDIEGQFRSLYQVNLETQRSSRLTGGRDLVFF